MFHLLRHSRAIKFLWGFLGLYFFNISVDTVDANPNHLPEDLSFNDQESIIEIIVEKVLGFENAIAEHDDPDTENHTKKNNLKIEFIPFYITFKSPYEYGITSLEVNCFKADSDVLLGHHELNSPPPEV